MALKIDFDKLRDYLRDFPEVNFLLNNQEQFPEELMESLLSMVIDDVVSNVPALSGLIEKIPASIIMYGLVSKLMESEAFIQLRNEIQVGDNNISSTSIYGKQGSYLQLAQMYEQKFMQGLRNFAKKNYYNNCWGSVPSKSEEIEFGALLLGGFNYAI